MAEKGEAPQTTVQGANGTLGIQGRAPTAPLGIQLCDLKQTPL